MLPEFSFQEFAESVAEKEVCESSVPSEVVQHDEDGGSSKLVKDGGLSFRELMELQRLLALEGPTHRHPAATNEVARHPMVAVFHRPQRVAVMSQPPIMP